MSISNDIKSLSLENNTKEKLFLLLLCSHSDRYVLTDIITLLHRCYCSESIYKVPGDDTHFYGTFTTSTNGLMGSAICSFHIDAIQEAFRGKFKEQATSSSAWLPVLSNKVPEPRPGQCVNDTETLPDTVLNFIRSHPLMDSAISHENEKPVFYKRDVMLTRLVVDKLRIDFVGIDLDYTVYYAGSSKQTIEYLSR